MIPNKKVEENLFKMPLRKIVNFGHPLCRLSSSIDWDFFDREFKPMYCPDNGRPAIPTRLMVGLNYLKYMEKLSDEEVVIRWIENPYWQYFCGGEYFEHEIPCDPSSLSRWRKKIAEAGNEKLLEETIKTGFREGVLRKKDIERVNVDTTVQEKNITFPTDAKLYYKGICLLGKIARKYGIRPKQSFERVGKQSLIMQSRYAHAKQMKRAKKEVKRLKTYLGRLLRDVERKASVEMKNDLRYQYLVILIERLLLQKKDSKNKLYSFHAPETECISKGKAHKRYEFGCKVGIVSSSKRNFILGAAAFHGNPYDGHTLQENLDRAERLTSGLTKIKQAFVDMGYRGHGYEGEVEVHIVKRGIRRMKGPLRRWFKRRSGIEADIGHLKNDHRLDRNYLTGEMGDEINVLLSSAGFNLRKLWRAFLRPIFIWLKSAFKANYWQRTTGFCAQLL